MAKGAYSVYLELEDLWYLLSYYSSYLAQLETNKQQKEFIRVLDLIFNRGSSQILELSEPIRRGLLTLSEW